MTQNEGETKGSIARQSRGLPLTHNRALCSKIMLSARTRSPTDTRHANKSQRSGLSRHPVPGVREPPRLSPCWGSAAAASKAAPFPGRLAGDRCHGGGGLERFALRPRRGLPEPRRRCPARPGHAARGGRAGPGRAPLRRPGPGRGRRSSSPERRQPGPGAGRGPGAGAGAGAGAGPRGAGLAPGRAGGRRGAARSPVRSSEEPAESPTGAGGATCRVQSAGKMPKTVGAARRSGAGGGSATAAERGWRPGPGGCGGARASRRERTAVPRLPASPARRPARGGGVGGPARPGSPAPRPGGAGGRPGGREERSWGRGGGGGSPGERGSGVWRGAARPPLHLVLLAPPRYPPPEGPGRA